MSSGSDHIRSAGTSEHREVMYTHTRRRPSPPPPGLAPPTRQARMHSACTHRRTAPRGESPDCGPATEFDPAPPPQHRRSEEAMLARAERTIVVISGDNPPCTQSTWPSSTAASAKKSNSSVQYFLRGAHADRQGFRHSSAAGSARPVLTKRWHCRTCGSTRRRSRTLE
jgi:hypothetical protein